MKKLSLLLVIFSLAGCSHVQQVNHRNDSYDRYYDFITIYNSPTLQDAQLKANRFCNGKAFAIPELREMDLKRLQSEKDYLRVDPAAYHFKCNEMEAMRVRGMYGDKASQTLYEKLLKAKIDEQSKQSAKDYEQLRQAAKAPGFHSTTTKLPGGAVMTRSYGNGLLCESVYDQNGGYSSCDDVNE
ncbi:hypothetical protein SAMN05216168_4522 [Kosakonia radicincitans]|nr:hypothetical protein SAMN05216168_4522 [Kosakonia radicincitans]